MKKEFKIKGMSCNHCREHIEKALNNIEGIKASVSLNPPLAIIEFEKEEKPIDMLQEIISEEGDYQILE